MYEGREGESEGGRKECKEIHRYSTAQMQRILNSCVKCDYCLVRMQLHFWDCVCYFERSRLVRMRFTDTVRSSNFKSFHRGSIYVRRRW